jgi:hypothetical protein
MMSVYLAEPGKCIHGVGLGGVCHECDRSALPPHPYYIDIEFGRVGVWHEGKCIIRFPGADKEWDEAGPALGRLLERLQRAKN